jgi:ribosome maturation factor RimP
MPFACEKLRGLDRDALLGVVDPVLRAHHVQGVELIWRTDNRGWVLYLTVERPEHKTPGAGVTLDQCSEISRDLSAALDVSDVIDAAYRLEVGTPGLERHLYTLEDYERFAGYKARLKARAQIEGQWTLRGTLLGLDEQRRVQIDTDSGMFAVAFEQIETAQLVFEGLGAGAAKPGGKANGRRPAKPKS